MNNKIEKQDYKICFINFSFDERVYLEDISRILLCAKKYPNASLYCCEPHWNSECQTFCLAHSKEEAKEMFDKMYPTKDSNGYSLDDIWTDEIPDTE